MTSKLFFIKIPVVNQHQKDKGQQPFRNIHWSSLFVFDILHKGANFCRFTFHVYISLGLLTGVCNKFSLFSKKNFHFHGKERTLMAAHWSSRCLRCCKPTVRVKTIYQSFLRFLFSHFCSKSRDKNGLTQHKNIQNDFICERQVVQNVWMQRWNDKIVRIRGSFFLSLACWIHKFPVLKLGHWASLVLDQAWLDHYVHNSRKIISTFTLDCNPIKSTQVNAIKIVLSEQTLLSFAPNDVCDL